MGAVSEVDRSEFKSSYTTGKFEREREREWLYISSDHVANWKANTWIYSIVKLSTSYEILYGRSLTGSSVR